MTAEMLLWCRDDWWNAADEWQMFRLGGLLVEMAATASHNTLRILYN
jgi:hypothetical protein